MKRLGLLFICLLFVIPAKAQIEHQLMRRVVVFPLSVDPAFKDAGDEAWWQIREELTKSHRFLVASKQFLIKSDVYQARSELQPADAIILGRLLDAHALVVSKVKDRKFSMTVYDGTNGLTLWHKDFDLHPSLTVQDQMPVTGRRMINDFIASVPYEGFETVDPLIGKAIYQEKNLMLTQVDIGVNSQIQIGDVAQWIRLTSNNTAPLFQSGARVTVYAEGQVIKISQGIATIELIRVSKLESIKENGLVRFPREFERLQNEFAIRESIPTTVGMELLKLESDPMENLRRERKPLVTTLSFIGSLVAAVLLAF
jgi:hypothetical protein